LAAIEQCDTWDDDTEDAAGNFRGNIVGLSHVPEEQRGYNYAAKPDRPERLLLKPGEC
jgi:hypothetical protein